MRVGLIVSGGVDPSGRDIVPAFLWLIERLARQHDLSVFALHYATAPREYDLRGARVYDLGTGDVGRGLRRWTQRTRLARTLRRLPPFDVLHAWWAIPAGWVATAVAASTPVVVTASSGEFAAETDLAYGFQRRWLDRRLVAATLRRAALVTVPTHAMQRMAAHYGVSAVVIPHGVPPEHVESPAVTAGPPWRLIHIGHLNAVKDQTTLIDAFALVRRQVADVHLDVVGEDTLGGVVQRRAAALGVSSAITFHGGLPHEAVRRLVRGAHAHILSSRHEAGGVAVLDAAAAGVPTVGTDAGYVADWAPDAAVAVPRSDPAALSSAITSLLADHDRRGRLARAAQARAVAYSADHMSDAFSRLYHDVAPHTNPGSSTT